MSEDFQPTLLSMQGAAAYLDLSEKTVRRYIDAGKLPAYRAGARHIRIRIADLEALLTRVPPR